MANTYVLISSQVLGASAATVTFSSIPSTYTDLVLRASARSDIALGQTYDGFYVGLNGSATTGSGTHLTGSGVSASSTRYNTSTGWMVKAQNSTDGNGATANTFGTAEVYIPSYTASQAKPLGIFGASETNASATPMSATAGLWNNTATVSSIVIYTVDGSNWLTGSSFYLYGIKNS